MPIEDDIREAARRALEQRSDEPPAGARVTRAILDVTVEGRTEIVSVVLREGGDLAFSCTSGKTEEAHVVEALRLLAAGALERLDRSAGLRTTSPSDAPTERTSLPPGRPDDPVAAWQISLAEALEDVVTAVLRVGVDEARSSPTVNDTLERLVAAVPSPLPLGISRWLGRLRGALAGADVDTTAHILEGATRIVADLRSESLDAVGRRRLVTWLGRAAPGRGESKRISDRTLLEVSREYLHGAERLGIERRHLVCLETGEIFREERARGGAGVSVGPSPRIVQVGLGEVDVGAPPRRLRLLQYAVSSAISAEHWSRLLDVAVRSFRTLARNYRRALTSYPGLAEPFAVVAPKRMKREDSVALLDADDLPLPLARAADPSYAEALSIFVGERDPDWVAGRLLNHDGTLLVVPCTVGMERGLDRRILRIG